MLLLSPRRWKGGLEGSEGRGCLLSGSISGSEEWTEEYGYPELAYHERLVIQGSMLSDRQTRLATF